MIDGKDKVPTMIQIAIRVCIQWEMMQSSGTRKGESRNIRAKNGMQANKEVQDGKNVLRAGRNQ